jgi:hypothetical protein
LPYLRGVLVRRRGRENFVTIRLDEVLQLLPDTGLTVRRLDQWEDGSCWTCVLEDGAGCDNMAQGDTALEAITLALRRAGFNVEDVDG